MTFGFSVTMQESSLKNIIIKRFMNLTRLQGLTKQVWVSL